MSILSSIGTGQTARRRARRGALCALGAALCIFSVPTHAQEHAEAAQAEAPAQEVSFASVETRGRGETHLILLPGLSADWRSWEVFLDDLDNLEEFTMHAVTLPGFGGTEPWPAPAEGSVEWIGRAVQATVSYIEGLPSDQAVVLGHGTLGGFIALGVAIERPDLVSECVVIDALAPAMPIGGRMPEPGARQQMVDQLAPAFRSLDEEQWAEFQQVEEASINRNAHGTIRAMFDDSPREASIEWLIQMMRVDMTQDLEKLETPTLFLFAWRNDMPEREQIAKHLTMRGVGGIPVADYCTVGRSRRFMMMDRPDGLNFLLRKYLRDHEVEAALP
jgi:pimeloyl-ACP methyl ester carboxylesterase